MAKRKAAIPRTHRKITLTLSADTDEKLAIQSRREGKTRSWVANDIIKDALRQLVISIRSGDKPGQEESAA